MPQVIAAAVVAVAPSAGATAIAVGTYGAVTTISYATIIGYAATIGGALAYGQSQANRMRNSMKQLGEQGRNVMARDPLAYQRFIYGEVPVTGPVVFMSTSGTKNEWLHVVITLAGHEVDSIGTIYFDDMEEVALDGGGYATGKYAGHFICGKHLGTADQLVDGSLSAQVPSEWTANHRLRGTAYLACSLKFNPDLFPNGLPTIKAMVRGKKVYDPRTGLTAWSDNPVLCAADYMVDTKFGRKVPSARMEWSLLEAEADICDESISLNGGGTEKRYTCNGTGTSEQDALPDILASMAGRLVDTGGRWSIQAGAYRTPGSIVLTDDLLVGPLSVQTRASMRDTFNGVKGTYVSPKNAWMPADFPAVKNDTYMAQDGGVRRWKDVSYPFVTSAPTAQRLSKIDLERGRQQIVIQGVYRLDVFGLAGGDTVKVTRAELGWTEKPFEIVAWKFRPDLEKPGVMLILKETASGVWDWADGEETPVDLAPNTNLPDPSVVPTPSLTLLSDTTTVTVQPDGTVQPRLKVTRATPNNIYVENGGVMELEYKKTTDSDWSVWTTLRGDQPFDFILDVKVGVQYDVRARFRNQAGVRGDYGTATSSAIVGDTVAPNAATGISVTAYPGYLDLRWTPSTSITTMEYQIWRKIGAGAFALLANTAGAQFIDTNVTAGILYSYYVVATSFSEIDSAASPTVSATALTAPVGVAPTAPSASSNAGVSGTYDSSDGSVFAYATITVPALPANALFQNLLYRRRRTGATEWTIAAQLKNTGSVSVRLDDLSPGVVYDIATQAWNSVAGSAVTAMTGTSLTAATKTGAPSAIASGALNASAPARKTTAGTGYKLGCRATWAPATEADFAYYEIKATTTNSDAATDYVWGSVTNVFPDPFVPARVATPVFDLYEESPAGNGHVRVRKVNSSFVAGPWLYLGNALSTAVVGAGSAAVRDVGTTAGTVAAGDDTRITGAAQKSNNLSDLSNAATARSNLGVKDANFTKTLTGGAATEVFTHNHAFGVQQYKVIVQCVSDPDYLICGHDYGSGSNDANNTAIKVATLDGTNIVGGTYRFTAYFIP